MYRVRLPSIVLTLTLLAPAAKAFDDPADAKGFYERAREAVAKGEYDQALKDLNEAVRLDPKFALAVGARGGVWHRKGEYGKAMADYDEAIRLDPKLKEAWLARGRA